MLDVERLNTQVETPKPGVSPEEPKLARRTETKKPVTTPGGIPGIPMLTIGTTSTITAVSTLGLAAGPAAAALLVGGLVASAAATTVLRSPRLNLARKGSKAGRTGKSGNSPTALNSGSRRAGAGSTGSLLGGPAGSKGGRSTTAGHRSTGLASPAKAANAGAKSGLIPRQSAGTATKSGLGSGAKAARSRVADVRAARAAAAATPASRKERRQDLTASRRGVADARRDAKQAAKDVKALTKGKSVINPGDKKGLAKAKTQDKLAAKRDVADARREAKVNAERKAIGQRTRSRARVKALRRSANRHHARRLGNLLLASPIGALSLLMAPLAWLFKVARPQWGRRVYARLAAAAQAARSVRDRDIEADHDAAEKAAEAEENGDQEDARPPLAKKLNRIADPHEPYAMEAAMNGNFFDFRGSAEDMFGQASAGEPGGMMGVLAAFDNLPDTLGFIAGTFAVVANRCAEELPLDPAVADAIEDIYKLLMQAADAAEGVSKTFRERHEDDIQRHEDPRNGEELWDTTNNQD
jgi:hypothetical protein